MGIDPNQQREVRHTREFQIEMVALAVTFAYGALRQLHDNLRQELRGAEQSGQ